MAQFELEPLPPKEAVAYFERKGYRIGFDWRDVWQQEHARAFTVAKATSLDLLEDIRRSVDAAIAEGGTLQEFRKELEPKLRERGWWGKQRMVDPLTGQERVVQLGSPRRLRIIYDTNLRMAHAAGRWERIQRVKDRRPWLRYVAILDGRTRPAHRAWNDLVLHADDPFWRTHAPPNGWRCRCTIQQMSDRDLAARGLEPGTAPQVRTRTWRNPRTGQTVDVPRGIDPGFAYNVGTAAAAHARTVLTGKLDASALDLARASVRDLVRSPAMADFTAGRGEGDFPVGVADEGLARAMKASAPTVVLSADRVRELTAGGEMASIDDWRDIDRVIAEGATAGAGRSRRLRLDADGRVLELDIERDAEGRIRVRRLRRTGGRTGGR